MSVIEGIVRGDIGGLGLEELMLGVAARDRASLAALYRQIGGYLQAIAKSRLFSHEDAEEVVCDVFVFIWRFAPLYDPSRGSVRSWLGTITRNRCNDVLRRRRRATLLRSDEQDLVIEEVISDWLGPEDLLVRHQIRIAVNSALQRLSPLRRQMLALSFFDGLTHQEIADRVGMPLGTVKSHVRRALVSLRVEVRKLSVSGRVCWRHSQKI